jgi:hypothetical protein
MTQQVIGFEGYAGDECVVTYGAAAFYDPVKDRVTNAVSRFGSSNLEEWNRKYVGTGAVTTLKPHDLVPGAFERHCMVMRIPLDGVSQKIIRGCLNSETDGCLMMWVEEPKWRYLLFSSFEEMKPFMCHAAALLREYALANEDTPELHSNYRVLDPYDGMSKEDWIQSRAERHGLHAKHDDS